MRARPKPADLVAKPGEISPRREAALNALNDGMPLLILGLALLFSIRLFAIGETEALTLKAGAQPLSTIVAHFPQGASLAATSPLYALVLHAWLFFSAGALVLLRAPSSLFLLTGVWILSRAARPWGGERTVNGLLWLAALWPYAFHYGSQATEYSFLFLVISLLLLAYLQFCESRKPALSAAVVLLCLLLIYATYFGWVVVAFLAIDHWLRERGSGRPATTQTIGTLSVLALAYIPLWPATLRDVWSALTLHPSARILLLDAGYNLYVLIASESVAPWFWRFGIAVTLAIVTALVLTWFALRWEVRRLLLLGVLLLLAMDVLSALQADRLFLVAPLFLLPIAVALCTTENRYVRGTLTAALLIAVGVGWFGAFTQRYYSTARFAEPWSALAAETAGAVQQGAGVISDSPSILLYLTYYLRPPVRNSAPRFSGFLPDPLRNSQVWDDEGWDAAGRPMPSYMIWMDAGSSSSNPQTMADAAASLDSKCGGRVARYLMRDPAYDWKKKYFPQLNATPWRMEIRQYLCGAEGKRFAYNLRNAISA